MKNRISLLFLTGSLAIMSFTYGHLANWNLDSDFVVAFKGKGASGTFSELTGDLIFDPNQPQAARIQVQVAANTIDTGNKTKTKHAKGESWLNAETYPFVSIQSERISTSPSGFNFEGKLSMHGVTKAISFPFQFTESTTGGLFEGKFTVNRQDFGIEGPFLSFMVDDEIEVSLKVPVSR